MTIVRRVLEVSCVSLTLLATTTAYGGFMDDFMGYIRGNRSDHEGGHNANVQANSDLPPGTLSQARTSSGNATASIQIQNRNVPYLNFPQQPRLNVLVINNNTQPLSRLTCDVTLRIRGCTAESNCPRGGSVPYNGISVDGALTSTLIQIEDTNNGVAMSGSNVEIDQSTFRCVPLANEEGQGRRPNVPSFGTPIVPGHGSENAPMPRRNSDGAISPAH